LLFVGLGLAVNGHSQSFLTNGLVAYYPFNGNAFDGSGNGNNGTIYGATLTADRFGEPSNAYAFNGTNNYVQTPSRFSTGANPKSFSVWLNPSHLKRGWIIDGGSDGFSGQTFGLFMELATGKILFHGNGPYYDLDIVTVQPNRWYHLCVTYDGTTVQAFADGNNVSSKTVTLNTGNIDVKIGSRQNPSIEQPGDAYFDGFIDDIRIYNRALSTNEVAQLYAIESGPRVNFVKAFTTDYANLILGSNYQLQASTDLKTWTNYGAPFTATSVNYTNTAYQRIDNWGNLFFRLQ